MLGMGLGQDHTNGEILGPTTTGIPTFYYSDDMILGRRASYQTTENKLIETTTNSPSPVSTGGPWPAREMPFVHHFHGNGPRPTPGAQIHGSYGSHSSVVEARAPEDSLPVAVDTDSIELSPGAVIPLKMGSKTDESFCFMCLKKVPLVGNFALDCNQHAVHSCMERFHGIAAGKNKSLRCPICKKK